MNYIYTNNQMKKIIFTTWILTCIWISATFVCCENLVDSSIQDPIETPTDTLSLMVKIYDKLRGMDFGIEGARIYMDDSLRVSCNDEGWGIVHNLSSNQDYSLHVEKDLFLSLDTTLRFNAEEMTVLLPLLSHLSVSGKIITQVDGADYPVFDVNVQFGDEHTTTDITGQFLLPLVQVGALNYTIQKERYHSKNGVVELYCPIDTTIIIEQVELENYFPVALGNSWTYDFYRFEGDYSVDEMEGTIMWSIIMIHPNSISMQRSFTGTKKYTDGGIIVGIIPYAFIDTVSLPYTHSDIPSETRISLTPIEIGESDFLTYDAEMDTLDIDWPPNWSGQPEGYVKLVANKGIVDFSYGGMIFPSWWRYVTGTLIDVIIN